jgi:hypothetical protein
VDDGGMREVRMDVPLSFAERRFASRIVTPMTVDPPPLPESADCQEE